MEVVLRSRPAVGCDVSPDNFETRALPPTPSALPPGHIRLRLLCLSVDPYMRCRFNASTGAEYLTPFQIGERIVSGGAAQVLASDAEGFSPGDLVVSQMNLPWAELQDVSPAQVPDLAKLLPGLDPMLSCGPLGMPGLSAFHGVAQCKPQPGELCVLSSCAGAVGSLAGQLLRRKGLRVVGICGSADKCKWSVEQGAADVALCYKDDDFEAQLQDACGDSGVNLYFDNVGGTISEAVIRRLAQKGRVVVCGQISSYNQDTTSENYVYPDPLPADVEAVLTAREGSRERFFVGWYADQNEAALREIQQLVSEGALRVPVTWAEGLSAAGAAFCSMMKGEHTGKVMVRCAAPDHDAAGAPLASEPTS